MIAAAIAVVLLLLLISYWKIHAFFALLFSTLILGLMSGMPPHSIVTSFQKGIADLLGSIAIIIAAGAVMGRLIQITGAGEVIAEKLIRLLGNKRIPLAVFLFAYLIGIPVFFDVAFITFIPLIWNLGRIEKKSLLLFVLPFVAALMTTTGLVPTNPGPAAAAQLLGADLGKTMLYGLALGVPMAIVGGIVYGGWISKRIFVEPIDSLVAVTRTENEPISRRPSFLSVVLVILLPVTLMGGAVLLPLLFSSDSKMVVWARFVGNPSIALLCATAFAYLVLGVRLGLPPADLMRHTGAALNSVGSLILIVGASGAFKQVVLDSGAGSYIRFPHLEHWTFALADGLPGGSRPADDFGVRHRSNRNRRGTCGPNRTGISKFESCADRYGSCDRRFYFLLRERRRILDGQRILRNDGDTNT